LAINSLIGEHRLLMAQQGGRVTRVGLKYQKRPAPRRSTISKGYGPLTRAAHSRATGCAEVPFIGGTYCPHDRRQQADLIWKECRALAAREWFERSDAPHWTKPLVLREDECAALIASQHNNSKIQGYYCRSLRWNNWAYDIHPSFNDFACGLTEWIFCPEELMRDRELARRFPPKELAGLTHPVQWRPPKLQKLVTSDAG
jgi:hypothetical protein